MQELIDYERLGKKYDAGRIGGYLSYPVINFWRESISDGEVLSLCQTAGASDPDGAYLYFHFPYCRAICTYCACYATAAARPDVKNEDYTSTLLHEIERKLEPFSGRRLRAGQLHWGGGTPSLLTAGQIRKVCEKIDAYVVWSNDAVRSIEMYPDETSVTDEKLRCLKDNGFTQISFGIESFDPNVLKAINRGQDPAAALRLFEKARKFGFGVYCDLVYGLPFQDLNGFSETIDAVIKLEPDRLATFAFLYTPRTVKHQRAIKKEWVPDSVERIRLYQLLEGKMLSTGYTRVGVDHFVKGTDDPLARAALAGDIVHHFQGYEPASRKSFLGFGSSAISYIDDCYFQNLTNIGDYTRAVLEGRVPTSVRVGHRLSYDDKLRANIILQALMCRLQINKDAVEKSFSIRFDEYFRDEIEQLKDMELEGLVQGVAGRTINVTAAGRPLLRVICRVFDRYARGLNSSATVKREWELRPS